MEDCARPGRFSRQPRNGSRLISLKSRAAKQACLGDQWRGLVDPSKGGNGGSMTSRPRLVVSWRQSV